MLYVFMYEVDVINVVTDTWNDHWKASNEQREFFVSNDDDLEVYSGKTLYVWEGNNKIFAWVPTILTIRESHPTNFVGGLLEAMHDVNRYITLTSSILNFFFPFILFIFLEVSYLVNL